MSRDLDLSELSGHISGLVDALRVSTKQAWEYSEPIAIGGPPGQYTCQSPFTGDCEWKVDIASAGGAVSQIVVSSSFKNNLGVLDYTGASSVSYTGRSGFDGLVMNISASTTSSINSEWYNVRNSENLIYVIIAAASGAAFANIIFRQKRK